MFPGVWDYPKPVERSAAEAQMDNEMSAESCEVSLVSYSLIIYNYLEVSQHKVKKQIRLKWEVEVSLPKLSTSSTIYLQGGHHPPRSRHATR